MSVIEDWFNEVITVQDRESFSGPVQIPRKDRIAFLVYANGGFQPGGYGFISGYEDGHQQGLYQDQFFALLQIASFMEGVAFVSPDDPFVLFKPHYDDYRRRVAEAAAARASGKGVAP